MRQLKLIFLLLVASILANGQVISVPESEKGNTVYVEKDGKVKSSVFTVSTLRASSTTAKRVTVTGLGNFILDAADLTSVDDGKKIIVNSKGKRYKFESNKFQIAVNGTEIGVRGKINFVNGTNVTVSGADVSASDVVNVTINSSGGGGGGSVTVAPNSIYGNNTGSSNGGVSLTPSQIKQLINISPADISASGATTGQVIKYNGSVFALGNDEVGGGGGSNWGGISGTLSNQTDLQTALNLKLNIADTTVLLRKTTAAGLYQPKGSYLSSINSSQVTTALGFTPYNSTNPSGFITASAITGKQDVLTNGSVNLDKINQSGATINQVPKWNGSTWIPSEDLAGSGGGGATWGTIPGTLSNQTDLQTALNLKLNIADTTVLLRKTTAAGLYQPKGTYLSSINFGLVVTALGFTPYNSTNPSGFINASSLTPYLTSATAASTYQPIGSYLTSINSSQVTTALGFTPYNSTNPNGYITAFDITGKQNVITAGSLNLDKINQSGATINQIPKWNGSAWVPSADATGGSPTWGSITGTVSSQADLQTALSAKENTIAAGTTAQYWRGDKTWQTHDKASVGLNNVDNTSDLAKPISTATQTALSGKANTTHSHAVSDLTQTGATSGQVIKWNGSAWSPAADNSGTGRKSILDYGAIPNDGLSDHVAIQNAINANAEVYIPEGVFLIGASLNIPSDRKVYGDGSGSVLKASADNVWILKAHSPSGAISNIIISDLKLDGGGQTSSIYTGVKAAYGVYISNATNVVVERLTIDKCGIVNSSSPISDNGWGGLGIVAEARHGVIRNIKIRACHITNIAGGGMNMGDGIYIAGYNTTLSVVADNVVVSDCYVENVGRHCYTVAGEGGESPGYNTTFLNCKGKNAALSGIDFEEGNHCRIEGGEFEGCGNYTGYYNPISLYGALYRLCVGVATGNESNYVTVKNIRIKDCYYGVTAGSGTNNRWEGLVISNSTIADFGLGLARFGEDNTIKDCKFLTENKPMNPFYNMPVRCGLLVENCIFASDLNVSGQWYSAFKDCVFKGKVSFTGAEGELKNILFQNCTFTGTRGLSFENVNTYCDDFVIDNCKFQGGGANYYYGIYVVYQSVRRLKIENCTFNNYLGDASNDGYAIRHINAEAQSAFASVSNNNFINCDHGIVIYQGGRYAQINNNRFTSIPNWCIWIQELTSAMALKACTFVGNIADNTCANGLRIDSPSGSWDYVTIVNNQFEDVTATKYSMNTAINNLNGNMAMPTAFRVPLVKTANFTLNLSDAERTIRVNSSSDITCTIATDALVNFAIGTKIKFEQIGTGKIIFTSPIQLNSEGSKYRTAGVRAVCEIEKVDYDQWTLNGSLISSTGSGLDIPITTKTANYTLTMDDKGGAVEMNVGGANTLTVPPSSSVNYPIGAQIIITQYGVGQTTITAGSGVTIRSAGGGLKTRVQYSGVTLVKRGTDEWYALGDLTN